MAEPKPYSDKMLKKIRYSHRYCSQEVMPDEELECDDCRYLATIAADRKRIGMLKSECDARDKTIADQAATIERLRASLKVFAGIGHGKRAMASASRVRKIARITLWDGHPAHRAKCDECGMPYEFFVGDMIIQDSLWDKITSIPPERGLLCPDCICKRILKLPGVTVVTAQIDETEIRQAFDERSE